MAAPDLDVVQLSYFCSVPQTTIATLLSSPTTNLVHSLLAAISSRAREFGDLKAQTLKLTVELESAVRGGEGKSRLSKISIEKAAKETEELRQKLEAESKI